MTDEHYDGVWRPERLLSGSWVATRYIKDLDLNRSQWREEDIISRNGVMIANYFDTQAQCEERCIALNRKR
jgi:hypothetical protein